MNFINRLHKQLWLDGWRGEGIRLESGHCKSVFYLLPGASILRSVGSQVSIYHWSVTEMWIHNKSKANLGMLFSNVNCAKLQTGRVRICRSPQVLRLNQGLCPVTDAELISLF